MKNSHTVAALLAVAALTATSMAQCTPTVLDGGPGTFSLDYFGDHMAVDGNTLVVGATDYNVPGAGVAGAAAVFTRAADGYAWTLAQVLTEGAAAFDSNQFGRSVDVDMNSSFGTIVVGAPYEKVGGAMNAGVVRIFQKAFGSWINTGTINNPFPAINDTFGYCVAINGDELLIGAPGDDTAGSEMGAVYVYRRVNGAWTYIQTITHAGWNPGLRLGEVIDVRGQWAVLGAPHAAMGAHVDEGGVFWYRKDAAGHWNWDNSWDFGGGDGALTGAAVALGETTFTWSKPGRQWDTQHGLGFTCTVFNADPNSANGWAVGNLVVAAPTELAVTGFGTSLAQNNHRLLVGATGGPFRAFLYNEFTGTPDARFPAVAAANSAMGRSVGLAGSSVLVGDPNATARGWSYAGNVLTYNLNALSGANDCSEALPIGYGSYYGCTTTASPTAGMATLCGNSATSPDLWFQVSSHPANATVIDTIGSGYDTVLSIHNACPPAGAVACDDDSAGNHWSRITIPAEASKTYLLRLAGYSGASGEFTLNVSPGCGISDFNGDGDYGTDADIEAFFACLAGNCCSTCGTSDFNGDGDYGTDADIESFFRVLGGGAC